jgi:ethylbenzene dioxygenase ferredoxin subunit
MDTLVKLAKVVDVVEGVPVAAAADGFPPLAVYQVDNRFFVTDNNCTHGHARLTDGFQEGGTIECPFHGGAFEIITGAATKFPCQLPLRTYDAIIDDGHVCVRRKE